MSSNLMKVYYVGRCAPNVPKCIKTPTSLGQENVLDIEKWGKEKNKRNIMPTRIARFWKLLANVCFSVRSFRISFEDGFGRVMKR